MEAIYRPSEESRWSLGAGLHLAHWKVDSCNTLMPHSGDPVSLRGGASWNKAAFSLVGAYRLTPFLEGEVRWIGSRYGYEDLKIGLIGAGVLWRL